MDNAAFCENGHCIEDCICDILIPSFCTLCGALVITRCSSCGTSIKGLDISQKAGGANLSTPKYCHDCGSMYPWTKSALDAAHELVFEDEKINDSDKQIICLSFPDIISETPKTALASRRFVRILSSAGKFTAEGLRQFAIDFACEYAKKSMGI